MGAAHVRRDRRNARGVAADRRRDALTAVLDLQRSAGNRAVTALLGRAVTVQRLRLSDGTNTKSLTSEQLVKRYMQLSGLSKGKKPSKKPSKPSSTAPQTKPLKKTGKKKPVMKAGKASPAADLRVLRRAMFARLNDQVAIAEMPDETLAQMEKIANAELPYQGKGLQSVDSIYYDKPPDLRPVKGQRLFTAVYLGGAQKVKLHGVRLYAQPCQEPGCPLGGLVYFSRTKPYKEYDPATGKFLTKAPPICHKTPYAVLVKALLNVVTSSEWTRAIQPGAAAWDEVHYQLAWGDLSNLGPGHAACNSRTAATGKRKPTSTEIAKVKQWARKTFINGVPVVQR